jgi:hypothetical protein
MSVTKVRVKLPVRFGYTLFDMRRFGKVVRLVGLAE